MRVLYLTIAKQDKKITKNDKENPEATLWMSQKQYKVNTIYGNTCI